MYRRPHSLLPSPRRLSATAERVQGKLADIQDLNQQRLLDMLGDLALWFSRRPATRWAIPQDEIVSLLEEQQHDSRLLSSAVGAGLLVSHDDNWAFADLDEMTWLAARRMATTDDDAGDFSLRLHGLMFDVTAQAIALTEDQDQAASLVNLALQKHGPFEELLHTAHLLAASAVAWGAPSHPDLRAYLVNQAIGWTNPGVPASHSVVGAGLLGAELRDNGPHAQIIREGLGERLGQLFEMEETTPEMEAFLETCLLAGVCAFEDDPEASEKISGLFPNPQLIGLAVGKAWSPGPHRDTVLKALSRLALLGDDPGYTRPLAHVVELGSDGTGMLDQALQGALDTEPEQIALFKAMAACETIAEMDALSPSTGQLLERLIVAAIPPDLRVSAGQALGAHRQTAQDRIDRVHDTLAGFIEIDSVPTKAGAVGALLEIGNAAPTTATLAVMLVADGIPPAVLAGPLERGLRHGPGMVQGILDALDRGADELIDATVVLALGLGEAISRDHRLGPFIEEPPLHPEVRRVLLERLLPFAGDLANTQRCGRAAVACGWLGRGQEHVAETFLAIRDSAPDETTQGMLDMALGAVGPIESGIRHLGQLCAHGAPDVAAKAGWALSQAADCYLDFDAIDEVALTIKERLKYEGPQQEPLRALLFEWATLPAGFDPEDPELETLRELRDEVKKSEDAE